MPAYAELQVTSNFSFLRGASHPEELVVQAQALGLAAIALTDRNSLAGVVRAHQQAKESSACASWSAAGSTSWTAPRCCAGPPTGRPTPGSARCSPSASGARPKAAAR